MNTLRLSLSLTHTLINTLSIVDILETGVYDVIAVTQNP